MPPHGSSNPAPKTESAREARKSFYCELCSKGYARMNEFEAHEGSYDHLHTKRLKEMKQMSRDPSARSKALRAERRADEKSGLGLITIKPLHSGGPGGGIPSTDALDGGIGGAVAGGGGGTAGGKMKIEKKGFKKGGFRNAFGGGGGGGGDGGGDVGAEAGAMINEPEPQDEKLGSGSGTAAHTMKLEISTASGPGLGPGIQTTTNTTNSNNNPTFNLEDNETNSEESENENESENEESAYALEGGRYDPLIPTGCGVGCRWIS